MIAAKRAWSLYKKKKAAFLTWWKLCGLENQPKALPKSLVHMPIFVLAIGEFLGHVPLGKPHLTLLLDTPYFNSIPCHFHIFIIPFSGFSLIDRLLH